MVRTFETISESHCDARSELSSRIQFSLEVPYGRTLPTGNWTQRWRRSYSRLRRLTLTNLFSNWKTGTTRSLESAVGPSLEGSGSGLASPEPSYAMFLF